MGIPNNRISNFHHTKYFSPQYCKPSRMASYGYQIKEVMARNPKNLLEIGPGNGIVSHVLRNSGLTVTTLDICKNPNVNIVGTVTDIPLHSESFDLVLCSEVLAHIPYDQFEKALLEIRRVTRRHLVMTLPDRGRYYRVEFRIPKFRWKRSLEVPFRKPPKHEFDGEHYWEIGKQGYPLSKICNSIIKCRFSINKTYRLWENPSHRMFVGCKCV